MKRLIAVVVAVILVALAAFFGWQLYSGTPTYSLKQMYKAVQARNYSEFNKYFDVSSVVNNRVNAAVSQSSSSGLADAFVSALLPGLKDELTQTIKAEVEKGTFQSSTVPGGKTTWQTTVQGDTAKVVATNSKSHSKVTFDMRHEGSYWQVFDVEGLDAATQASATAPAQQVNAKFGAKANITGSWFLTVSAPTDYQSTNEFEQPSDGDKFVAVQATYQNTSNQPGTISLSNLELKDSDNHEYTYTFTASEQPQLNDNSTVEAGGTVTGYVTYEVPSNANLTSLVYTGPITVVFSK